MLKRKHEHVRFETPHICSLEAIKAYRNNIWIIIKITVGSWQVVEEVNWIYFFISDMTGVIFPMLQ